MLSIGYSIQFSSILTRHDRNSFISKIIVEDQARKLKRWKGRIDRKEEGEDEDDEYMIHTNC